MARAQNPGLRLAIAAALISTPIASYAATSNAQGLEEIVVTAQKREEKLSETPVSITALSAADLERTAATQFRDFAATVPGLSFTTTGAGSTQVNLRGITTGSNVSPTVGIYVDEVPYGSSTAFAAGSGLALDVGLFDVQRVEILRGPQGTLYGASTMGGLLKYVPQKPDTSAFSGTVLAGLSSTEHGGMNYDLASAVNVPLSEGKAAMRLSGFYSQDGGYIDNLELGKDDVNQADIYGGRGDFLFTPTDRLSVRVGLFAQDIKRDGSIETDYNVATHKPLAGDLEQFVALSQPFDQEFRLASATVNYKFDFAELTSVTSFQTADVHTFLDATDLYVPLLQIVAGIDFLSAMGIDYEYKTDKFVQEVRLASTGERLDWLVGAFYTNEDSKNTQIVKGYDLDGALTNIPWGTVRLPSSYEEIAGFATLNFHATSKLDLQAGLRYSHNSQEQEQKGSGLLVGSAPKRDSSESPVTYLANLRYLASDQLMWYLRVATGYRPGGPNVVLNDPETGEPLASPTFDSDSLTSYEAGIKLSNADRRYTLDAAIYQIDWNDMQIIVARNGVGVVGNAGAARSRGAELTLTARPVDALTLQGAFAYNKAELTEDSPATDLGAQKGDPLPNTPEFTAALSADYDFDIATHGAGVGATWRYVDDRVSGYDSGSYPQFKLDSYDALDLRGHVDFGRASVQLYVKNVTDERGQLSASTTLSALGGPAVVSIMQPRTYGVAVRVGF
jgi:outer membrane receptor protein involved in Fe transport